MALDATRVTVLGGGKRKVPTRNRRGRNVYRYDVRWRAQIRGGSSRMFRERFDRAADADAFANRLTAVGLPGSSWVLDDDGRPVDAEGSNVDAESRVALTVWTGLLAYRSATWRGASGNGRRSAAVSLRAMAVLFAQDAPAVPPNVPAYLDLIAFRSEHEPNELALSVPTKVRHAGSLYGVDDLMEARRFLERWSLPLTDLNRTHVRTVVAELGTARSAATEGRRWTQVRTVLRWWRDEGYVQRDLTSKIGLIRGTSLPVLSDDEPIPDVREMWLMAWALCLVGKPEYGALPLVMGGAGLRIGECCELRRRDCHEESHHSGMWLTIRGSLASPGRSWTDSGAKTERRGTKAKGPDGDLRGRRSYLPPAEAAILRTHLARCASRTGDSLVFTSTTGRPLEVAHLQERAWKRARQLAFPEPHRLHSVGRHAFRHLAATRWLRSGVPLKTAARWGGWKDVATMLRWYESRLPGDDDFAAERMAQC